jgi:rRNA small subunit pseudouridine methyltransferase Nep1
VIKSNNSISEGESSEGKEEEGTVLLELKDSSFAELVKEIDADKVIGLSTVGVKSNAQRVVEIANSKGSNNNNDSNHCAFVIGAFPKGHFSENITKYLGPTYSISDIGLEAHVVVARVLYECEKMLLLPPS